MGDTNGIVVHNFSINYLKWYLISIIIVLLEYAFVVILTNICYGYSSSNIIRFME